MLRGDCYRFPSPRHDRGHEQTGARLAVIVQSDEWQQLSTVLVAPTSRATLPRPFRPEVVGMSTRVMVEQARATDPTRLGELVDHLSCDEMSAVDDALRTILDL